MLVDCRNCGAPLDASRGKPEIKCNYCGVKQFVEALVVREQVVPPGWRAPQVWIPPENHAFAGQQFNYRAQNANRVILAVVFVPMALTMVGGVVTSIVSAANRSRSSQDSPPRFSPPPAPPSDNGPSVDSTEQDTWSGASTFHCDGTDKHVFSGVKTATKLEMAVDARIACEVDLTNPSLHADHGIFVDNNAKVVVHGGTLRAHEAVVVKGNGHVELHDVHVIISGKAKEAVGFDVEDNGTLDLFACTVEIEHGGSSAEPVAFNATGNARVKLHGGKVTGHYIVRAANLAKIEAIGADVAGKVEVDSLAKVEGVRSTEGKKGEAHAHAKH